MSSVVGIEVPLSVGLRFLTLEAVTTDKVLGKGRSFVATLRTHSGALIEPGALSANDRATVRAKSLEWAHGVGFDGLANDEWQNTESPELATEQATPAPGAFVVAMVEGVFYERGALAEVLAASGKNCLSVRFLEGVKHGATIHQLVTAANFEARQQ